MDEKRLQALEDREAIYDLLARYCRAVDRSDEVLLRSVYHPDAAGDHGAYRGDVDGFVDWVKSSVQNRFRCTVHKLGNAYIELDGDVAYGETYAIGHHVTTENGRDVQDSIIGLRYVDRFERRAGSWKIADRKAVYEWRRVDDLRDTQVDPHWTLGRHDMSDQVYLSP
jgi:hypothetical protein